MNVEAIAFDAVLILHGLRIGEGGGDGRLRDEGDLQSALARPADVSSTGNADIFELAAAYACGIVQSRPFVEGNAGTAFVVAVTFLDLNGQELRADEAEAARVFLRLAAGELAEGELAEWLRANASPPDAAYLVPEQDQ